jgi:hypothetical protein
MERMARAARQSGMTTRRQVHGPVAAAVLCAALAGCGSVAASSTGGASGQPAQASGCAGVNQATSVTIRRSMHLVEPVRAGALNVTRRKPALVQALFRDFCNAVGHPDKPGGLTHCPASLGMDYTGTFYDGTRSLATFVYGASGCQTLSVTGGGKRQSTVLYGTAAAAAPRLQADMAAVLGVPKYAVSAPQSSSISPGGPNK